MQEMNQRYIRKLHKDLKKYSKQIGISQKDMPELATDKYRLRDAIMEKTGDPSFSTKMYYRYKNKAGICFYGLKIVFVNTHQRYLVNTQKEKVLTYRNFLLGLIHKLVHYRFENELEHGLEFDHRIMEIIRGKIFPQMKIKEEAEKEKVQE
jgi:hypothetical protein